VSSAAVDLSQVLARDNVELREGSGTLASRALILLGALLIGITFVAAFAGTAAEATIALHAYHAGTIVAIGFSLAAMGMVMILHQTNAGWSATVRRQFENIMSLIWVGGILMILSVAFQWLMTSSKGVYLFEWMNTKYVQGDLLYEHKQGYLNLPFFYIRMILYFVIWLVLSWSLFGASTQQDIDGDRWRTARARTISAPGLLLFAMTTAFAGFDWMMTLDFHWFSTMFGVYFFAGSMVSAVALATLVLIMLRSFGRLHVAFSDEHLHDLAKLLFAFTVFWAYISFSQYFLIWYANIPEETAWMVLRKQGPWEWLSIALPIGHFIIPFIILMPRPVRRNRTLVALVCVWLIVMHCLDIYWAVRPEAELKDSPGSLGPHWIDFVAIAGPVLVFLGVLIRQIGKHALIPIKDPRLIEGLTHKNYV